MEGLTQTERVQEGVRTLHRTFQAHLESGAPTAESFVSFIQSHPTGSLLVLTLVGSSCGCLATTWLNSTTDNTPRQLLQVTSIGPTFKPLGLLTLKGITLAKYIRRLEMLVRPGCTASSMAPEKSCPASTIVRPTLRTTGNNPPELLLLMAEDRERRSRKTSQR